MRIPPLPFLRDPFRHLSKNMRSQMRHADPRQNQITGVIGDQANVAAPRLRAPADEPISSAQMSRRAGPSQTRDGLPSRLHQKFEMFPYRLLISQIVILFDQAVEQLFLWPSPLLLT